MFLYYYGNTLLHQSALAYHKYNFIIMIYSKRAKYLISKLNSLMKLTSNIMTLSLEIEHQAADFQVFQQQRYEETKKEN